MSDACGDNVARVWPERRAKVPAVPRVQDILEEVMTRKGWSSADVASRIGVNQETVDRWRRGERNPGDRRFSRALADLGEDPTAHGLPPAPAKPGREVSADDLRRIEAKLDALIVFHRSGGNTDHLDGL